MKTLKLSEIRQSINLLFEHLDNELGIKELPVEKDYYWNIPISQSYRLELSSEEIGKQLDVGSLAADEANLLKVIRDPTSRVAFQLTYAASLMRYIGEFAEAERLKNKSL